MPEPFLDPHVQEVPKIPSRIKVQVVELGVEKPQGFIIKNGTPIQPTGPEKGHSGISGICESPIKGIIPVDS